MFGALNQTANKGQMVLAPEIIERRLRVVDQTSESIQTTSMWIMHHKESIAEIVKVWNETFKTASDTLQVALFYVANDVCQKAKKRGDAIVLLNAFAPHWTSAISIVKSSSSNRDNGIVIKTIERILDIFDERQVYSKSQLDDMRSALNGLNDGDDTAFDFETDTLARDIEAYQKGEMVMERARGILARSDFNFKDKIKSRMKDRQEGEKFLEEIDMAQKKLDNFLSTLAKHKKRGTHLMEVLEAGRRFFTLQLRDVTVVEDAYQKFSSGIDSVRLELEEMIKINIFPGASPPRDAPSPTPNEDPFQAGVESVFEQLRRPRENTEVTDMDVENDDDYSAPDPQHSRQGHSNLNSSATSASGTGVLPVHEVVFSNFLAPSRQVLQSSGTQSNVFHAMDPRVPIQSSSNMLGATNVADVASSSSYPISTIVHSSAAAPQSSKLIDSQKDISGGASAVPSHHLPIHSMPNAISIQSPMMSSGLTVNTDSSVPVSPADTSKSLPQPMQFSPMGAPPNWMMIPPPNFSMPPNFSVPPFPPLTTISATSSLPSTATASLPNKLSDQKANSSPAQNAFANLNRFPIFTTASSVGMPIANVPSSSNSIRGLSTGSFPSYPPPPFVPAGTSQSLTSPNVGNSFPPSPATTVSDVSHKSSLPTTPTTATSDPRSSFSSSHTKSFEDNRRFKHDGFRNYDSNRQDSPYDRPIERKYSHGDRGYVHGRNDRRRYGRYEPGHVNGSRDKR